jgi:uncharacterized protein YjdB
MTRRLLILLLGLLGTVAVLSWSCSHPVQPVLEVTPTAGTLVSGQTSQLAVTRRFPGGPTDVVTDRVVYSTSDRNVATVSDRGVVTAGAEAGNVVIRISDTSSDAVVTVTFSVLAPRIESIDVAPGPAIQMRPGEVRRFSATAHLNNGLIKDVTNQVIWASSLEGVATVGRTPADFGVVTGVAIGETTISATDPASNAIGRSIVLVGRGDPVLRAIVVTPNPATITAGQTLQLSARGIFSDGSTEDVTSSVTWSSARAAVATVDATGLALGVAVGETTITAAAGETDGGAPSEVKGSTAVAVQ